MWLQSQVCTTKGTNIGFGSSSIFLVTFLGMCVLSCSQLGQFNHSMLADICDEAAGCKAFFFFWPLRNSKEGHRIEAASDGIGCGNPLTDDVTICVVGFYRSGGSAEPRYRGATAVIGWPSFAVERFCHCTCMQGLGRRGGELHPSTGYVSSAHRNNSLGGQEGPLVSLGPFSRPGWAGNMVWGASLDDGNCS